MLVQMEIDRVALDAFMVEQYDPDNPDGISYEAAWQRDRGGVQLGYRLDDGPFANALLIGSQRQIQSIVDSFTTEQIGQSWLWSHDGKVDYETEYTGQHNDLLLLQKPHIEYDENGDPVSETPASFGAPNWAHQFYGQGDQVFARSITREFAEDYS